MQRATIYNRPHREGISHLSQGEEQFFFESAMLLEEIKIENEYIKLSELHFYTGNKPFETFQELAWKTSEITKARQSSVTSYHWMSPDKKGSTNSFENLKNQIDFLNEIEPSIPIHTLIINRGYCVDGDWLEPNENWQNRLDNAAREIFKEGYRAGIWIAPFLVSNKSKVFENHPDWLVKDYNNNITPEEITEEESFFALDASHPEVLKHIAKIFRTFKKMGFLFFETAFLDYGFKDSLNVKRATKGKTSVQVFREACEIIRAEIGAGSLWMADHTPFSPIIGFADIVRTNNRIDKELDKTKIKNIIKESWYSHYFNNIYWQNSPGEIDILNENNLFTEDEINSIALWIGILGGAVETCNNMTRWNQNQLKLFRFFEPNTRQKNAYLPFWPDEKEIKVAVRLYKQEQSWGVLFFNDNEESINKVFNINTLIEEDSAFTFGWEPGLSVPFGKLSEITITLQPYQSTLFYLCKRNEAPPLN